ncbi:MAG: hypothetical protein ACT4QG_05085 [Sporichthyaceae bacterium]
MSKFSMPTVGGHGWYGRRRRYGYGRRYRGWYGRRRYRYYDSYHSHDSCSDWY